MFYVLAITSCALSYTPEAVANGRQWFIDRHQVSVGGCVAIVIEGPARIVHKYKLRIDDREPMQLADGLGVAIRWKGHTVVLLSHDLRYVELIDSGDKNTERVWIPPLFRNPGTLRLTMEVDGKVVGTDQIQVVAGEEEVRSAIERLFPIVNRKGTVDVRERDSLWPQMLVDSTFGLTSHVTPQQLQQLRGELLIVKQHPDWREICEMRLARLEAFLHFRHVAKEFEEAIQMKGMDDLPEEPPIPEIVTRALKSKLTSAFAKAIQDEIRGGLEGHKRYVRYLRGEPYWEIIEANKVQPAEE